MDIFTQFKEFLNSIPSTTWSLIILFVLGTVFVIFVKFNGKILDGIARFRNVLFSKVSRGYGGAFRNANKKFKRSAYLNKESKSFKIYRFFDDIIINLDLTKNNVTVFGLLLFTALLSVILTLMLSILIRLDFYMYFISFVAFGIFVIVVFRFSSLSKKEKREDQIMDAIDLLVSDVKGGVFNAIVRYMDSFHPDIRPYFLEFVDNMQTKGLSFKASMNVLNDRLGFTFSDFAHKAIMYEEKADEGFEDIFSAILETNRQRRLLRAANNIAFNQIMQTLIVSFVAIAFFAVYIILTEYTVRQFLLYNAVGKLMIIGDVVLFAIIMGYLTGLKSKTL